MVVIRNRHTPFVNAIGFLLCLGSLLLFLREMIIRDEVILVYLAGVVFISGLFTWNFIKTRRKQPVYFSKALLIAGLVWTKMPYFPWLIFVFVVLALLEYQAKLPLEIGFSRSRITFNSLIRRNISWSEIANIVLRDGLLTIDYQNNRLFQREVDEGEREASDQEFNNWCQEQLKKSDEIALS